MPDIHMDIPAKNGSYRVWELVTGLSTKAYWDSDLVAWIFPKDFPNDPNYEYIVDYWCEL